MDLYGTRLAVGYGALKRDGTRDLLKPFTTARTSVTRAIALGYHTVLMLRPEDELGVILMDNAADRAAAFAPVVFAILDKRKGYEFKGRAPAPGVDLEAYTGHYSGQPLVAESVILPWAGGLVSLSLPDNDPVANLEFFKPKGGDIFRRVREDGSEAEELEFPATLRAKSTGYIQSSNPKLRMSPIEQP